MTDPNGPGPTMEDLKRELAAARAQLKKIQEDGDAGLKTWIARVAELEGEVAVLKKASGTGVPKPKDEPAKPRSWAPWDPA